jgi:hypothetical protein
MIDIWGANDAGCYSRFSQGCDPPSDAYNLRGRFLTNALGEYDFETIKPGKYLNGSQYRPSHIHIKVQPPSGSEWVSQIYFEGDSSIPDDPWAKQESAAKRIVKLYDVFGTQSATFDVILDAKSAVAIEKEELTAFEPAVPNPLSRSTAITYSVMQAGLVHLAIFDALGREVRTLTNAVHSSGSFKDIWDGKDNAGASVLPGSYLCRLTSGSTSDVMRLVVRP